MGYPLKYPAEALRRYLSDHPNASYQEIAQVFSGTIGGVKTALYYNNIKLRSIPERKSRTKYPRALVESYFASHPESTVREAAQFFKGTENALYNAMKSYGFKAPRMQRNKNV
jgi:hypothetical protein